jgi:hypothetical protein
VVRAHEPHHLEGEGFLAEVVRCAKPDRQINLPEGLNALARCDAMERHRAGPQLVQPDSHQPQGVRVQDVEATASVRQHLGEPQVAVDWIDNQRVLSLVRDAVRVILVAEGDGAPPTSRGR